MSSDSLAKAHAKIQRWKQNFLDLSNRNPQINFLPNKAIEILKPDVVDCFKVLVQLGVDCTFPPIFTGKAPKKGKGKNKPNEENITTSLENEETALTLQSHQEAIDKFRNTLTQFVTNLPDLELEKRIQKLRQKDQEFEEEKGVSILFMTFGLLNWLDPRENITLSSPILYAPIQLNLDPLQVVLQDDNVFISPALQERFKEFRIYLPNFSEEIESLNFSEFFNQIDTLIQRQSQWRLERRCFIADFTFTKISLYMDMNEHTEALLEHPIVRSIAEETGFREPNKVSPELLVNLDHISPNDSFTIVDADSSQMEAILLAKNGVSLIIQGPPGTGKSQCITNIIAECLGSGKTVLFVAEKRAALDVVFHRLENCQLGDFCLQLHSQNENKKELIKKILQSTIQEPFSPKIRLDRFEECRLLRGQLNEYTENINHPYGSLSYSLYEVISKLLTLSGVPLVDAHIKDPFTISKQDFYAIRDHFTQLEQFRETMEKYNENPWQHAKLTNPLLISYELKKVLLFELQDLQRENKVLQTHYREFLLTYPSDFSHQLDNLSEWDRILGWIKYWQDGISTLLPHWTILDKIYRELSQYFELEGLTGITDLNFQSLKHLQLLYTPKTPPELPIDRFLLEKLHIYNQQIKQLSDLVTVFNLKSHLHSLRSISDLVELNAFLEKYTPDVFLLDSSGLLSRFTLHYLSWWHRTGSDYKADRRMILQCVRSTSRLRKRGSAKSHLTRIKTIHDKFGQITEQYRPVLQELESDLHQIMHLWHDLQDLHNFFQPLLQLLPLPSEYYPEHWDKTTAFCAQWLENLPFLNDWFEVQVKSYHLTDLGVGDLFNYLKNVRFEKKNAEEIKSPLTKIPYVQIFEKAFFSTWYAQLKESLPPIVNFDVDFHQQVVNQFRIIDEEILKLNQFRLHTHLMESRPRFDQNTPQNLMDQKGYLEHESKKKHSSHTLREIFSEAKDLITFLKPCLMMSPMAIADYLPAKSYNQFFDIVIFDEASQVTPENAIGAILRGKSLVVVGDSKQLPPTDFFVAHVDSESGENDSDLILEDPSYVMESILDECTGIGFQEKLLKYHYRSKKEGLITFSNHRYYNGRLFTFPDIYIENPSNRPNPQNNPISSASPAPIDFEYIAAGKKENGVNIIEAQQVARAIITHYQQNTRNNTKYSLGIVALNQKQQDAIRHELDLLIQKSPELGQLIASYREEPLFIKNLENVQGDERDVIFLSIGYARESDGAMSLNFGPINRAGGYRRLNVAITRARVHIKLYASFLPTDIPLEKVKAEGLRDLILYMMFAQSHCTSIPSEISSKGSGDHINLEPDLIKDIKFTLECLGYQIHERIGTSDYRLDLAVVDPADPARYKLGIECDAGSYARAATTSDRDRIRTKVMGYLGWNILHIWSTFWFEHKIDAIKILKKYLE